jgi:O-antigen/teichoic acid export membrane protein
MDRNTIGAKLKTAFASKSVKQVTMLFGSQLFFLFGGMVSNILTTRSLDPSSYGRFSFAFSITDFILLFVNFGFYTSGARVIALAEGSEKERRELIGGVAVFGALLVIVGSLIFFVLSYFTVPLFKSDVGSTIRLYCPLFSCMGLITTVEYISRGNNSIGAYSIYRVAAKSLHLMLIGVFLFARAYVYDVAVIVQLIANLAASLVFIVYSKPLFTNIKASIHIIIKDVKVYGWNAYLGSIASSSSYRTDSMIISAYATEASVGFYNLGNLLTFPMATFSRSVATTLFKDFTKQDRIPRKVIAVNLLWLVACAVGLIALRRPLITLLFGAGYEPVIDLIPPLALTALLLGLSIPLNMYLGAQGKGKYLRNIAFIMTAVNLGLNFLIIPKYQAMGAAVASLLAMVVNLVLHYLYYRKHLHARNT